MRGKKNLTLAITAAAAFATLVGTSAFADFRPQRETRRVARGDFRHEARVQRFEGRITHFERDRDGYRVHLEGRREWFRVPELAIRYAPRRYGRFGDLRAGLNIRLNGAYGPGGFVNVSDAEWIGNGAYRYRDYDPGLCQVRGEIVRVDRWGRPLVIRDGSRRLINVGFNRFDRHDVFRRGDVVGLEGFWRPGRFEARRLENIRRHR